MKTKKILFVNGSPNRNGHTAGLAKTLLEGREYETLNLTDYKVYSYGQSFPDDQFEEVLEKIRERHFISCFREQLRKHGCWRPVSIQ